MTRRYHANNIRTTLNGSVTAAATSIVVTSTTGFPSIGSGETYRLTFTQGTKIEIVEVTDDASAPTLTVVRAREGTTAQPFSNGSTVEIRTTADSHDRKQDQIATSGDVIDFGSATSFEIPNSAAPTVNADGEIALDTTITDHKGLVKYYSGEEMVIPAMPIANLLSNDGYSVMYDAATDSFKMAQAGLVSTTFNTIAVSGQSDVVADSATDTLTLVGSTGVTITTNASTDEITFAVNVLDANNNFAADSFLRGYTTTATAAGTTTLTVSSTQLQYFTGATTQNCDLPVTSTLVLGQSFTIVNNSSGVVTVRSSGGNTVQAVSAGTSIEVVCILTSGTTASSWNVVPGNTSGVSSLTGTANQITASASTGAVTLSIPNNPTLPGATGVVIPQGSTGSRGAAGTFGRLRGNTSTAYLEFDNGAWALVPTVSETITAKGIAYFNSTNNPTLSFTTPVASSMMVTDASSIPSFVAFTGSGAPVRATSPTLVTPVLGVASATSINFGQDALNYYDEGAFTPVFTFVTPGDISVSYSVQVGSYTRIGRVVTVDLTVNCTPTFTTGTGDITITGLPFTPSQNTTGSIGTISSGYTWPASRTQVVSLASTFSYVLIRCNGSAVGTSNMGSTNIVSGAAVNITLSVTFPV